MGPRPARLAHRVLGDGRARISATRSTFTAAASISCSRITRTRSRRARARTAASASRATGCTTASCRPNGEKMSKSLGNVKLDQGSPGRVRRRDRAARAADGALPPAARLDGPARRRDAPEARPHVRRAARRRHRAARSRLRRPTEPPAGVLAALEDDLNTPEAVAELFGLVRAANRATDAAEKRALARVAARRRLAARPARRRPAAWFARRRQAERELDDAEIDSLVAQRDALRRERNFKEADRIRQRARPHAAS